MVLKSALAVHEFTVNELKLLIAGELNVPVERCTLRFKLSQEEIDDEFRDFRDPPSFETSVTGIEFTVDMK